MEENERLTAQLAARGVAVTMAAARGAAAMGANTNMHQLAQGITRTVIAEETGQADLNRGAARFGQEAIPNVFMRGVDVNRFPVHGEINQHTHALPAQIPLHEHVPAFPIRPNTTPPGLPQPMQNPLLTPVTPMNAWPEPNEVCLSHVSCNFL